MDGLRRGGQLLFKMLLWKLNVEETLYTKKQMLFCVNNGTKRPAQLHRRRTRLIDGGAVFFTKLQMFLVEAALASSTSSMA